MTAAEARHLDRVASVGCCICRMLGYGFVPTEVHHIAEGSGKRSHYMTAGLCYEHHSGGAGLHGMGPKAFLRLHKLPTEYHLIGLVNRFVAEAG